MKSALCFLLLFIIPTMVHAEAVTKAMEDAFLSKLKSATANKDFKAYRKLFYESQDNGQWLTLQTVGPNDTILSDAKRTYKFEAPPPYPINLGNPVIPYLSPVFHDADWNEKLSLSICLNIIFDKNLPGTSGNLAVMPLIVKNGKLYVVNESIVTN